MTLQKQKQKQNQNQNQKNKWMYFAFYVASFCIYFTTFTNNIIVYYNNSELSKIIHHSSNVFDEVCPSYTHDKSFWMPSTITQIEYDLYRLSSCIQGYEKIQLFTKIPGLLNNFQQDKDKDEKDKDQEKKLSRYGIYLSTWALPFFWSLPVEEYNQDIMSRYKKYMSNATNTYKKALVEIETTTDLLQKDIEIIWRKTNTLMQSSLYFIYSLLAICMTYRIKTNSEVPTVLNVSDSSLLVDQWVLVNN